jgi:hypothetical protein
VLQLIIAIKPNDTLLTLTPDIIKDMQDLLIQKNGWRNDCLV